MRLKKWFAIFAAALVAGVGLLVLCNVVVDPFGVFGDRFLNKPAYNMTQNPRAAKIPYLDQNFQNYDSYLIGCSKTGSISTEKLNAYYGGARFYNMLMYGGDMYDIKHTADYILDNYAPKRIVVNLGMEEASVYNIEKLPLKDGMHTKVGGEPAPLFYLRRLFAHPQYSIDKLAHRSGYLPSAQSVFKVETGDYDKRLRDTEYLPPPESYAQNDEFTYAHGGVRLTEIDRLVSDIAALKARCEAQGVGFLLILSPLYVTEADSYTAEDYGKLFTALADVTDFWSFSAYSPVSAEPRFFYDSYHYKNAVGDMMLARIFEDASVYIPPDFGSYVTAQNVAAYTEHATQPKPAQTLDAKLPVLIYHGIGDEQGNEMIVSPSAFEAQLKALADAGYTTVSQTQLTDFVRYGTPLPARAVMITFDDGYENNTSLAMPILQSYGMQATVFPIGALYDTKLYTPNYPHFTTEQALSMIESGVFDIESHSFDLHRPMADTQDGLHRGNVLPLPGESEADYLAALRADFSSQLALYEAAGLPRPSAFAYPFGITSPFFEVVLHEQAYSASFTTDEKVNTLVAGLPQSLLGLGRLWVYSDTTPDALLDMLD